MSMGYTAQAGVSQQPVLHCLRTPCARAKAVPRSSRPLVALAFGGHPAGSAVVKLHYDSSPALQHQVRDAFIKRLAATNPAAAKAVAEQSSKYDFSKIASDLSGAAGLQPNDVADNLALYTAVGYLIANNDLSDPSPELFRGLRNQLAARLAADPRFASNADRAAAGEELKFITVIFHAGWLAVKKENSLPTYSSNVARIYQQQAGRDLRSVRLTNAGFVDR